MFALLIIDAKLFNTLVMTPNMAFCLTSDLFCKFVCGSGGCTSVCRRNLNAFGEQSTVLVGEEHVSHVYSSLTVVNPAPGSEGVSSLSQLFFPLLEPLFCCV